MSNLQNCLEKFKECHNKDELPSENLLVEFRRLVNGYFKRPRNEEKVDSRKSKGDYMWMTVNPRMDIALDIFKSSVDRAVSSYTLEKGNYVYEQRSEEKGIYNGFHVHMIAKRSKSPSVVEKEMRRYFKDVVGNDKHINISFVSESQMKVKMEYIKGNKKDQNKLSKCQNDVQFRLSYGLLDVYSFGGGLITC